MQIYNENKEIYEEIASEVGVPAELIAVIHYRENTSDFLTSSFQIYLHNGDALGKETVHVPKGIFFDNFSDAAKDAISKKQTFIEKYQLTQDSDDIVAMMAFAEVYNGLGYYNNNHISPYLYSGTNIYISGKYIEDGSYDESCIDQQIGVYVLLNAIIE